MAVKKAAAKRAPAKGKTKVGYLWLHRLRSGRHRG